MSTIPLASVLIEGTLSGRPAASSAGRLYFATDAKRTYYDNGATWDDITPVPASVALVPGSAGAFTVAHGLSRTPASIAITMTSDGGIWQASAPDATNLYLEASAGGITGNALCF